MAAAVKRQSPPTHPTVWVGLGLAAAGLLVSAYAYTGTRVYDITFAAIAILGGLVALLGIMTAAWGRAVMGARSQRASRGFSAQPAPKPRPVDADEPASPTIAAPPGKKRTAIDLASAARRLLPARKPEGARPEGPRPGGATATASLFAFRSPASKAPPTAPEPRAAPLLERVTVRCPECRSTFSGEGARPFTLTCPTCGLAAEVPVGAKQG